MRTTRVLLVSGLILFLAGAAVLWPVLEGTGGMVPLGIALLCLASLVVGLGAWRLHTKVDFDRISSEQRLWESGPLGRVWLRIRRRWTN